MRSLTLAVIAVQVATGAASGADDVGPYFEQLRRRGLYSVAEHYALSRLADPQLSAVQRSELTIELSNTFAAHALAVGPQQRNELWTQARDVVAELLKTPSPPRGELLRAQLGLAAARQAHALRWDVAVAPHDELLRQRTLQVQDEAVTALSESIGRCETALKSGRRQEIDLAPHELRSLTQTLQLEVGSLQQERAELFSRGTSDRAAALVDAQAAYRAALTGPPDVPRDALARLGTAEAYRLQRDFRRARDVCDALAKTEPLLDRELLLGVEACRLRMLLDEGQALAAAEAFLALRRREPVLPGELWLLQMQTLLALRTTAEEKQDRDLARHFDAELDLVVQRIDEQAGGAWSDWGRRLRQADQSRREFGESLDRLVTQARSAVQAGQKETASRLLAAAFEAARTQNQRELAIDLGVQQGTILLELQEFEAAAAALAAVVAIAPEHPRAAATDLLAAYALGRAYEEHRTQSRRVAYTAALERHLEQFASGPTAGDALFMLAQLQEQRWQYSQALPLYLRIAADHARYRAGTAGAARCQSQLVRRLKSLKQDWLAFHQQAVAELQSRRHAWTASRWEPEQGETLLELARLQLLAEPPDCRSASATVEQFDAQAAQTTERVDEWKALRQQALPLKLVAWAGSGRSVQARALLTAASLQNANDLLAIVIGLNQLAAGNSDSQFVDLTELLVDAVRQLEPLRAQLPDEARLAFDLARVRAYLVSGRVQPALSVAQAIPATVAAQRELATVLMSSRDPSALAVARAAWQRIEAQLPAGSPEWLAARTQVIETHIARNERAEAAKLLSVTRLLYPVGDPARYDELERRIKMKEALP